MSNVRRRLSEEPQAPPSITLSATTQAPGWQKAQSKESLIMSESIDAEDPAMS